MRSLSETLGWGRSANPALAGFPADPARPKVLLRGERGAGRSFRWRLPLHRPPPIAIEIALTLGILAAAAGVGAVRGGQYQAFVERHGALSDIVARHLGFGVDIVTISGVTHLDEPRILSLAGITTKNSLPFFDVETARAHLEADPLVKQASVRKLYPNQIVIDIIERTPYAVWQKDGELRAIGVDGGVIDDVRDGRYNSLPFVVGEGSNLRVKEFTGLLASLEELRAQGRGWRSGRRAPLESEAEVRDRRQVAGEKSAGRDRDASQAGEAVPRPRARHPRNRPADARPDLRPAVAGGGGRLGRGSRPQEGADPMTFRSLAPRMRQIPARKSAILSVLDVGASKVVCLIARLTPMEPSDSLRGRTHRCKVLGIGHQRSNGVKGGAIVDLQAAEHAVRLAIDAAERMSGVEVGSVIVNMSGGLLASQRFSAKVALRGKTVSEHDIHRVLEAAAHAHARPARTVLHALPTSFSLDATPEVRDPKGMIGEELGADLHVASCDSAAARNLMLVIERCHLGVEAVVATPYAAGLSTLVDDEAELGAAIIDFGGGSTTVGVFSGARLVHVDAVAVGGIHVTRDIARGLNISMTDAERLKTLYGACMASPSDDRESISVHRLGDDMDHPSHLPKSELLRIIRPRVEEILELVRDRLRNSGFATQAGRRLVMTGGACQLTGLPELARTIISGQVQDGTAAWHRGPARSRQESRVRRLGRPHGLSAGRRSRTFRTLPPNVARSGTGGRLCHARRAMAEREFLNFERFGLLAGGGSRKQNGST